jgi:hypothetical protein
MSHRALRLLSVLVLTLALAAPLHAAPASRHPHHGSVLSHVIAWLSSLFGPSGVLQMDGDGGGMIDPNGTH